MPHSAEIVEVLFETDCPEIIVARDGVRTSFLSVLVERTPRGDRFLCVPISAQRLLNFQRGALDLREALMNREAGGLLVGDYRLVNGVGTLGLSVPDNIPDEWFPDEGFSLPEPRDMSEPTKTHDHCWHSTGAETSTLAMGANSGTQSVECCHCGVWGSRTWHEVYGPIPGHGPHIQQLKRVYGDVKL